MNMYREVEVELHTLLHLTLDVSELLIQRHGHFTSGEKVSGTH
jgi:hypothetical protein